MKKWLGLSVLALFVLSIVSMAAGCKPKSTVNPTDLETSTPTITVTPSVTPVGTVVDNFESYADTAAMTNSSNPIFWASATGETGDNVTLDLVTTGGVGNSKYLAFGGSMNNPSSWLPALIADQMPNASPVIDLTGKTGIRFWYKASTGTGTAVQFQLMVRTANITDYSFWRYKWTSGLNASTWTYVQIPFTSFVRPAWGQTPPAQGDDTSLTNFTNVFQNVQGWRFAIVTNVQATNVSGLYWDIDNIEIY